MKQEELRELLSKKYNTKNWEKVINYVFPNVSILQNPQDIPHDNEKITSFKNLGEIRLQDGKFLKLFEIHVAENVKIRYNKVELRNLVAKLIDQENMHGVLAIYEQGNEDYRFTFTAKTTEFNMEEGDFETQETNHKRYTYILGENETCRTASERLYSLAKKKEEMTLDDVQDAFSVEKLSKQFFTEYKEIYLDFVQYITGKRQIKDNGKWQEKYMHKPHALLKSTFNGNERHVRDFVKLMLGRLVFIQFLQKKRWMGVPAEDKGWETGDLNFIHNAFQNFEYEDTFYSQFLEPLFYEGLGKPDRQNQIFPLTNTKVPYLDGGLFEKKEYEKGIVDFPDKYFKSLFEFFDRYNFTIDENDSEEHAVGIDPEMLGIIFENLLEDNKDKGAYYTPKVIVHYMCQESLIEYLKTTLVEKNQWPTENEKAEKLEENLRNYVKKKEAKGIIYFDKILAKALRNVKICDPAIGSGAFPIGLLNEIFQCIYVLHDISPDTVGKIWKIDSWEPNEIKKYIIQNSIYGVDIEQGAVDIARLRFWLSLIIDEPEPTALPNLDYKIVAGDSLLSKLGDEVIDIYWSIKDTSHGLLGDANARKNQILLKNIGQKQKEFFSTKETKKKLAFEIRNLKIDLLINQLKLMINKANMPNEPKSNNYKNNDNFVKATNIYIDSKKWEKFIIKLKELKNNINAPLEFFDWKLDFPEVMNELVTDKVGFDILIGNPPYVSNKNIKNKEPYTRIFKTAKKQFDLYTLFIELTVKITKTEGTTSLIIPDSYLGRSSFSISRAFLFKKTKIKYLLHLNKVFENANVSSLIFLTKKNTGKSDVQIKYSKAKNLKDWLNERYNIISIEQNKMLQIKNNKILHIKNSEYDLLNKLLSYPKNLADSIIIWRGEEIGRNADFIKEYSLKNYYPILVGTNIQRYKIEGSINYINSRNVKKNLNNYLSPKIVVRQLGKSINAALDKKGYITTQSIYNIIPTSNISLKTLLALMNSSLLSFIYHKYFTEKQEFPRILIENIKEIPLPNKNINISNAIERLVENKINTNNTSIFYDQNIDTLIYKLFKLNYDEILIIEPEFSDRMTKDEYDKFKIEEL